MKAIILVLLLLPLSVLACNDSGLYARVGIGYEFWKTSFGRNPISDFGIDYCQSLNGMTQICGGWGHHSSITDGAPLNPDRPDKNVMDAFMVNLRFRLW